MPRVFALIAAALALFVAACGGSDNDAPKDPVGNVPNENGIRSGSLLRRVSTRFARSCAVVCGFGQRERKSSGNLFEDDRGRTG